MSRLLWYTAIYLAAGWGWILVRITCCCAFWALKLVWHNKEDEADKLMSDDFIKSLAIDVAAVDDWGGNFPVLGKVLNTNIGFIAGWPIIWMVFEMSFVPRIKHYARNILDEEKES